MDTKNTLYVSAGRDYNHPLHGRYEYVIYLGEEVIARKSGFTSKKQALTHGVKHAQGMGECVPNT